MPLRDFLHPKDAFVIPRAEAAEYFEEKGIIPAELVYAMLLNSEDVRRRWPHLSPSIGDPERNCRREIVLKRLYPYDLDPLVEWAAYEGILWHRMLHQFGHDDPGWDRELEIPGPQHEGHPKVRKIEYEGRVVREVEVFDGIWLSGVIDKVKRDRSRLIDFKSTNYPWTRNKLDPPYDFGQQQIQEWAPQLNLYAEMLRVLGEGDPQELWAWRIFKGSRRREFTFRKLPIPVMSRDRLEALVSRHLISTADYMHTVAHAAGEVERDEAVKQIPMDGKIKRMFGDQKCAMYCAVREICYRIEGHVSF